MAGWRGCLVVLSVSLLTACANNQAADGLDSLARSRANYATWQREVSIVDLRQAASSGDAEAEYLLGYRYYHGFGVQQDTAMALYWFERSAAQKLPRAKRMLVLVNESSVAATSRIPRSVVKTALPLPDQLAESSLLREAVLPLSEEEQQLVAAPASSFTIQIMTTYDSAAAKALIRSNHLAKNTYLYRERARFIVVHGIYSSRKAATAALKQLPSAVQQQQPWVKPLYEVQRALR